MIGLLGGTFDPVHIGHLRCAWEVREQLGIEDFRLVPAGQPPHRAAAVSAGHHRLNMLQLAVAGVPGMVIDERELQRPGPSYMVDTLAEIRLEEPRQPIVLIIGRDSAASLDTWHRWAQLFDLAHLVVLQRPGQAGGYPAAVDEQLSPRLTTHPQDLRAAPAGRVWHAEVTQFDISSSAIRSLVKAGRSVRFLMPEAVREYMNEHGLYR